MKEENLLTKYAFGLDKYNEVKVHNDRSIYVSHDINETQFDKPIYRYMDFSYLIKLIESKQLFIPNRQRFSDLRELSEHNKKSLKEKFTTIQIVPSFKCKKYHREVEERLLQIWNQAVLCWTYDSHRINDKSQLLDENYLMWKCHESKNRVCRIKSSINRFLSCIKEFSHDMIIADVEYRPIGEYHLANSISNIFIKPDYYMDEDELRFVVLHNNLYDCISKNDIIMSIEPLELIDEITLSPFINHEEEQIMKERLNSVMGESAIKLKSSMLMEFSK